MGAIQFKEKDSVVVDALSKYISVDTRVPVMREIDEDTFKHEMLLADVFKKCQPARYDYWMGYQRGLRRAYHGENFGTAVEHLMWCELKYSPDESRRMRGDGYRDGLKAEAVLK